MNIAAISSSRVSDIARDVNVPAKANSSRDAVQASVAAANSFIGMLSDEQKSKAMYAVDDSRRPNWSNLPAGILDFERNGVRLGVLSDEQVRGMFQFLAAALSADGYRTVVEVVGADEVLSHTERAGHFAWTDENYWLAFFGEPSESRKWGWQFGGHHLGVNFTLSGGRVCMSPTFVGVEPGFVLVGWFGNCTARAPAGGWYCSGKRSCPPQNGPSVWSMTARRKYGQAQAGMDSCRNWKVPVWATGPQVNRTCCEI